ncbi:hypothetical protein C5C07_15520 [Haloferax sp. Atlit-4N]|uniref:DUF2264 domain-containing protein n=1 Tax=Haloferax sp. Atlit-4N TaxID=2077206 RepID=UPI000E27FF1F|nr:DUF2264 domain-containing protein [Haloferax sp. Atlit-4N]RDZ51030.1 hypothetical protein C5C07_15520 [Haloferax sp. Atlit-4N]
MTNPFASNPLETRIDAQTAVRELVTPLEKHASSGGALVRPGNTGAAFPEVCAAQEGLTRPLWGIVPLVAGGGDFDHLQRYRQGISNGTNPDHEEYWGDISDFSHHHVEIAPLGFALALQPDVFWDPLSDAEQSRLAEWLNGTNDAELYDCNWHWFRVLSNMGLRSVGADHDWAQAERDLERLEQWARDDGWYVDGTSGRVDYYAAWAMHTYGLIYAALTEDTERNARFRDRAAKFARDFRQWFADDGSALPYGRSLTYRFAQSSFWGALALADVEALPWSEIRWYWQHNLQWWRERPIFRDDGVLSIGYAYPTLKMSEDYNAPSSPYWALKAFLPLALSASHPFWQATPKPPTDLESRTMQEAPKLILSRDRGEVFALAAGQNTRFDHKYSKFAYSTAFGFGVGNDVRGLASAGPDNVLALSDGNDYVRSRENIVESKVEDGIAYSRWRPWDDVEVESWLVPMTPWHVRVHRLDTNRPLSSSEGGYGINIDDDQLSQTEDDGKAVVCNSMGISGLVDVAANRTGDSVEPDPNTDLRHPRTIVPLLSGQHDPGKHWIATAVFGSTNATDERWSELPQYRRGDGITITAADGEKLVEIDR